MDHGITLGPIQGLINMDEIVKKVSEGGATAVLLHKGIIHNLNVKDLGKAGIIMHVSASTKYSTDSDLKVTVGSVEEGVLLGVDAISVHINVGGSSHELEMLQKLGEISEQCREYNFPLLAMMYPRGNKIKNQFDPECVAHAVRVGAELGADIIKTNYTGDPDTFKNVVRASPVPVVIAGGPRMENILQLLEMVEGAMEAGGCGVSIGRNIFQHENPTALTRAIKSIVCDGFNAQEALALLDKNIKA